MRKALPYPRISAAMAVRAPQRSHVAQTPRLISNGKSAGYCTGGVTQRAKNSHLFLRRQNLRPFTSSGNKPSPTPPPPTETAAPKSNWFIKIGWALLGLVVIDQALQFKQEREDAEKRTMLAQMQLEADALDMNSNQEWDVHQPTKFQCKLLHVEPSLDGTKMLTRRRHSLQKGDVVEILEANVGPNGAYHLCRIPNVKEEEEPFVGWYPIMFLEKVQ